MMNRQVIYLSPCLLGLAFAGHLSASCAPDGANDTAGQSIPKAGAGFGQQAGSFAAGTAGTAGVAGRMPGVAGNVAAPSIGAPTAGSGVAGSAPRSSVGGAAGGHTVMPPVGTAGGSMAPGPSAAGSGMPPIGKANPAAPTQCPAPPAGSPDTAVQALNAVNQVRVAMGGTCMNSVSTLVQSAQAHCDYQATNKSNSMCASDAHSEIMGCMGFTGADVQSREVAAGYPRNLAYTEVANTFGNNPTGAVSNWIDTVYHRIPLLDPWTVDMGYGGGPGCDVIDIGRGMSQAAANTIAVYPYDGQTNVPPTWNGLEGPAPPAPAGGFPSSYIINIYAKNIAVTDHILTKDGDSTPLVHTWLDKSSPGVASLANYFGSVAFMYGAPFEPNTKYHVKIVGTYGAGALNVEWTFTTGAKRSFP